MAIVMHVADQRGLSRPHASRCRFENFAYRGRPRGITVSRSRRPIEIKLVGMGASEVVTVAGVRNVTGYAVRSTAWMDASGDLSNLDNLFYSYCADLLSNAQSTQKVTEEG